MTNYIYRSVESDEFSEKADIFGLDYYKRDSGGEDQFSREQTWFYVYGDEDLKIKFERQLSNMLNDLFKQDDTEWDLITLYPTSTKNDVNPHILDVVWESSKNVDMQYKQVIRRTENIKSNHELENFRRKLVNLKGSAEVKGVEGKNVIVVDNITLSGSSCLHATDILKEKGANKVACICLGMGIRGKVVDEETEGRTASEAIRERTSNAKASSIAIQEN